jgi:hypothetical protein
MLRKQTIIETIVAILAFLFLYTSLSKYANIQTFEFSLKMSPILKNFSHLVAVTLPALEIGVVILLTIPRTRLAGIYMSLILLSIFTIYLIGIVSFSKTLPCGCGGVISKLSWKEHIYFNMFFVIISVIGVWLQNEVLRTQRRKLVDNKQSIFKSFGQKQGIPKT